MSYKIYHTEDKYFTKTCISFEQQLKDDSYYKNKGFKRTKIYVPNDIWIGMKS